MTIIKILVEGIIISVTSDYAQQCSLDSQKDNWYDSLINVVRLGGGGGIVVIAGGAITKN